MEWKPKRERKWGLKLGKPEIGDIREIQGEFSYYAANENVPSALYRLDAKLEPMLSGSLEILNYWITSDGDLDADPSNARFEIQKIIGICGKRVVIQHLWEPVSIAIVEKDELIENANCLWDYFLHCLREVCDVLSRKDQSWDLFVIEYFLNDDAKMPRSEKYWAEVEKDLGEMEIPIVPGVEIMGSASPVEILQRQMQKFEAQMEEMRERMNELLGQ